MQSAFEFYKSKNYFKTNILENIQYLAEVNCSPAKELFLPKQTDFDL